MGSLKDRKKKHHHANVKAHRPERRIAKRDFSIRRNDYKRDIRAGENLKDVPEIYLDNLRTEQVL